MWTKAMLSSWSAMQIVRLAARSCCRPPYMRHFSAGWYLSACFRHCFLVTIESLACYCKTKSLHKRIATPSDLGGAWNALVKTGQMVLLCLGRLTFRRNSPSKCRLGQTTLSSTTQYWTSGLAQNFLSSVCSLWGGRRTVWKVLLQCMLCSNQSSSFQYGVPVPPKRTVSKPDNLQFFLDQQARDRSIVVFDWFNNLSSASHSDVSKGLIESYGEISYQDIRIHALT